MTITVSSTSSNVSSTILYRNSTACTSAGMVKDPFANVYLSAPAAVPVTVIHQYLVRAADKSTVRAFESTDSAPRDVTLKSTVGASSLSVMCKYVYHQNQD